MYRYIYSSWRVFFERISFFRKIKQVYILFYIYIKPQHNVAKLIELTFHIYLSSPTLIPTNIYFEVRHEKLHKIYIQNCEKMLQV